MLLRFKLWSGLLFACALLAGCATPEKAQALRVAALQFEQESLAAINLLENSVEREQSLPDAAAGETERAFVRNVRDFSSPLILPKDLDFLIDPDAQTGSQEAQQSLNDTFGRLRTHYTAFASMFDDLEQGSYFAAGAVAQAKEHAMRLTAQLTRIADNTTRSPPMLLRQRGYFAGEINLIRTAASNGTMPNSDVDRRLIEVHRGLRKMQDEEAALKRGIVEQCLKAAVIGMEVTRLIENYDKIDLNGIVAVIGNATSAAGELTGKDFSSLSLRAEVIRERIRNDPDFNRVVGNLLEPGLAGESQ